MSTQIFEQLRTTLPNKLRSRGKWDYNRTALQFQAAQPPSLWRPDLILLWLVRCDEVPVNSSELVSDWVQRNLGLSTRPYHDQPARTLEQTRPRETHCLLVACGSHNRERKASLPSQPLRAKGLRRTWSPHSFHLTFCLILPPPHPQQAQTIIQQRKYE